MSPTPWAWLTDLLDCAVTELEAQASPLAGAPDRQFVTAAAVAWDDCCASGGQLWTRVIEAQPVDPLPIFDDSPHRCFGQMGLHVGLGVIRCAHTLDDGVAPTASELTDGARQVVADMVDLRRAAVCCLTARRLVLGRWQPLIGGGCVGGEWDLWVPASFSSTDSPGSP